MHEAAGTIVFETRLGYITLAWSEHGLLRLALPERSREQAERRAAKWGDAASPPRDRPAFVAQAIDLITRYAMGESVDFTGLPFDLSGFDAFDRDIYCAALALGQGETTTYGALAEKAGHAGMARETGAALGRNRLPLVIPCHRITAANGKLGGFSAPGGAATKERLLRHEGVDLDPPAPAQASFAF
jgi:methylated-DNA-[protein]-cysteine S-methyltransferase